MDIIIGSGNKRMVFPLATGEGMEYLAKTNPVEHVKIVGNLKALVRRQPKVAMTEAAFARLKAKNENKRGLK